MPDGTPKPKEMRQYAIELKQQGLVGKTVANMCIEKFGIKVSRYTVDRWYEEHKYGKVEVDIKSRGEIKLDEYRQKQVNISFIKRTIKPGSIVEVYGEGYERDEPIHGERKRRVPIRVTVVELYNNFIIGYRSSARESFGYDEVIRILKV